MERNCNACDLAYTRFQKINVAGNCADGECELLIVGDYPRQEDDVSGYAFTGSQYSFIWDMLNSIGVKYQVTYLLKCIPVDRNTRRYRKPTNEEYRNCIENNFLEELKIINPKCILFMGQYTLEALFGEDTDLGDYRDYAHYYHGYKFMATYHPGYIISIDKNAMYNRLYDDIVYACRHAMAHRTEHLYKNITLSKDKFLRVVDLWLNDPSIEYIGFDTESNGLDPLLKGAKITSFSVSIDKDPYVGYNIYMYHPEYPEITDEDRAEIVAAAKKLLTQKKVVAHHAKHEHRFCKVCWRFTPNITDDTMYMAYILYLAKRGMMNGLKYLSGRFLAMPPWEEYVTQYAELFSKLNRRKILSDSLVETLVEEYNGIDVKAEDIRRFFEILKDENYYIRQEDSANSDVFYWMIPARILEKYAGMDACAPLLLMKVFKDQIAQDSGLNSAYQMMVEGAEVFANIELKGTRIHDIDNWTKIYQDKIEETLEKLRSFDEVSEFELTSGSEFNPNSSKQVAAVFFEYFKFPVKGMTGKGDPSTSEGTLIELIKEYREKPGEERKLEFLNAFRDYKKLKKMLTAYFIGLRRFIGTNNAFDGHTCEHIEVPKGEEEMHIHWSYTLHGTDTGRVSSQNPSIHTVPFRSDVKRLIVPHHYKRGGILVTADQSQLEIRVLSAIVEKFYGDPSLADAYRQGKDIHRFNASKIFKREEHEIVDAERRFAKTISFSLLYGASESSVAESTGRTREEVHELFESFYASFPGIKKYIDATHEYAKRYGCIRTPMGRVKYVEEALHPENRIAFATSLRQAQNAIIQSAGSDMSFQSIVYMDKEMRKRNLKSKVVAFVHDSITLDADPHEWFESYDLLYYSMKGLNEEMYWITCPLGVDCELTTNYGDHAAVKNMVIHEDGSRTFKLHGYDYVINDILEESKVGYEVLKDELISEEDFFESPGDLVARKAMNLSYDNKWFKDQVREITWKPKT